jgi:hypothetical protein
MEAYPSPSPSPPSPSPCVIQYVSDLHVERLPVGLRARMLAAELTPAPGAQVLVLAGDVGRDCDGSLAAVLEHVSPRWAHVVYVPGNHEYYGNEGHPPREFGAVDDAVAALVGVYGNVHLLTPEQPTWATEDGRVTFVGCTLWSDVDTKASGLYAGWGDLACTVATPAFLKALHHRHKTALAAALAGLVAGCAEDSGPAPTKVVVVTHHMPSLRLVAAKYRGLGAKLSCFASPCEWLFPGVAAWVYGHTHETNTQVMHGGCLCAVNAFGYPGENAAYDRAAVLAL